MGIELKIKTNQLIPTQKNLTIWQFKDLFKDYIKNPKDMIIPVRKDPFQDGKYLILDGHHGSCLIDIMQEFMNVNLFVWVAKNEEDYIWKITRDYYSKSFWSYNENILIRFNKVLEVVQTDALPKSIGEMRVKYSWLKDANSMFNYFKKH